MSKALRWWVAGLVIVGVFALMTWLAGALALPLVLRSGSDRWVVAAGLGVAVAALAALWGHSWVSRPGQSAGTGVPAKGGIGEEQVIARGERSIAAGGDITGIASTGDKATNIQHP